ncbi:MAG: sterol desaturase family protein [Deltaproteobacteria bacterium]|nr:sterol desaturase family protein [Nannocystaceae bacterium]
MGTLDRDSDALSTFVFLTISGYAFYLALAVAFYAIFFVWKRERFVPGYVPDWPSNRRALRLALASIAGNALLTTPIHLLIANGHSQIYDDVDSHGVAWMLASILLVLVVTETLVYWAHRLLHLRCFYRWLHVHHHRFRKVTPFVAVAFHPLDSFAQAIPHHLCAFIMPLHVSVYLGSLAMVMLWSVVIHNRVGFTRNWAVNDTLHHDAHHWFNKYNLGQYTTFWDRLCGTYRDPRAMAEMPR